MEQIKIKKDSMEGCLVLEMVIVAFNIMEI